MHPICHAVQFGRILHLLVIGFKELDLYTSSKTSPNPVLLISGVTPCPISLSRDVSRPSPHWIRYSTCTE